MTFEIFEMHSRIFTLCRAPRWNPVRTNITVGISCCIKKNCAYETKTKAHCKAKRNIFIGIEIQTGIPESAGFWSQHFLVHWTVFCLAARGHVPLRGDIRIVQAGLLTSFHSSFTAAKGLSLWFSFSLWSDGMLIVVISCRLKLS